MDQHSAAGRLDQHRLVGGGGDPLGIALERGPQRRDPEDLRRLRRPELGPVQGLADE